jgi:hypothetical protein
LPNRDLAHQGILRISIRRFDGNTGLGRYATGRLLQRFASTLDVDGRQEPGT